MIRINYQKLTADMLTSRNGRHCHKGETETTAVLPCTAQPRGGPWQEFLFLGPTPEQRSPSEGVAQDSPCEHTPRIIILRADFENNFSPDILTSPRYHCPFLSIGPLYFALLLGCLATFCACKIPMSLKGT